MIVTLFIYIFFYFQKTWKIRMNKNIECSKYFLVYCIRTSYLFVVVHDYTRCTRGTGIKEFKTCDKNGPVLAIDHWGCIIVTRNSRKRENDISARSRVAFTHQERSLCFNKGSCEKVESTHKHDLVLCCTKGWVENRFFFPFLYGCTLLQYGLSRRLRIVILPNLESHFEISEIISRYWFYNFHG